MNMRITVLGATGKVGALVTREALDRGLGVTALVRDPRRLPAGPAAGSGVGQLNVVIGELDDPAAMGRAIDGSTAVVCAVGVRYRKRHPWGGIQGRADVVPTAVRTLLAVSGQGPAPHVVLLSAFGAGESWGRLPLIARAVISSSALKTSYAGLTQGEDLLRTGHLPHAVVRAVTLTDAPGTGRSVDATGRTLRGNPNVARADVARLLLDTALTGTPGSVLVAAALPPSAEHRAA